MGRLASLLTLPVRTSFRASPENPSTPLSNPAAWLVDLFSGGPTKSGARINERSALGITAVWSCVRIIAETLATIPLEVYERRPDGGRRKATDHQVHWLLHDEPNARMSACVFRETKVGHVLTWGNSYAEIVFRSPRSNVIRELRPLLPDRTHPVAGTDYYATYEEANAGDARLIRSDRIVHVPGLGFDGLVGYSPIAKFREALGLAKAAEEFGAAWFGNGAQPGGVLKSPGALTPERAGALQDRWNQKHQGLEHAHKVAVLEAGMEYQQIGLPPADSQFIQSRTFQIAEIARIYRMQLHKLQELSRATFSNIEQQSLEHVVDTLRPWGVRYEQEYNRKLFFGADRSRYYVEHSFEGLLRGDSAARSEFYTKLWSIGATSWDEIRDRENLPRVEDGSTRFVPLNMVPTDQALEPLPTPTLPAAPGPSGAAGADQARAADLENRSVLYRRRLQSSYRVLFRDAADRFTRREVSAGNKAVKRFLTVRNKTDFRRWAEKFYRDHRTHVTRAMIPVLTSFAEQLSRAAVNEVNGADVPDLTDWVTSYASDFARRHTESRMGQLAALLKETPAEELADVIVTRLGEWAVKTPDQVADRETVQAGSSITKLAWVGAGVTLIRWRAFGDNCPLCSELDGRVVGVQDNFVATGETVGHGGTSPLHAYQDYPHPPLHRGCDCSIVPT